ncbi:MAG: DUF952 domain-containing protein [Bacteroidota bacterium]
MREEIAFCHLDSLKTHYRAVVTDEFFIVEKKGASQYHPRSFIKEIKLNNKKLLMPLVSGGILSSLSLVSIIVGVYNPWGVLISFSLGLAVLYYGYRGRSFLVVEEVKNDGNYLLYEATATIRAFVNYVNTEWIKRKHFFIYHLCTQNQWNTQKDSVWYEDPSLKTERFIHACLEDQIKGVKNRFFSGQNDLLLLKIDPHKVNAEVRFESAKDVEDVFPHIYGKINKNSIIEVKKYSNPD